MFDKPNMKEIKGMKSPTMWVRIESLTHPDFTSGFQVLQEGRFLVDQNDDLWFLVDSDGTHNMYRRDERILGDRAPESKLLN